MVQNRRCVCAPGGRECDLGQVVGGAGADNSGVRTMQARPAMEKIRPLRAQMQNHTLQLLRRWQTPEFTELVTARVSNTENMPSCGFSRSLL